MGKELQKVIKKLGADFYFSHKVTKVENTGDEVVVSVDTPKGGTNYTYRRLLPGFSGSSCLIPMG